MRGEHIPTDATIADVITTLADADGYLRNVRHKMYQAQQGAGVPVIVRIGVTGKGIYPAYKIEFLEGGMPPRAFGGQLHRPFSETEFHDENWSQASMTFAEVTSLLEALIAKTAKR